MTNKKNLANLVLVVLFCAFLILANSISLVTDWWWFSEVGYTQVFLKSLLAKAELFGAAAVFTAVFLIGNLYLAARSKITWKAVLPAAIAGRAVDVVDHSVKKAALAASLVLAFFFGLAAAAHWQEVLKFVSGAPFKAADPIFNQDVGFYTFVLPIVQIGLGLLETLIIVALAACGFIYFLRGSFHFTGLRLAAGSKSLDRIRVDRLARMHLGILAALLFAVIAVGAYLSRFNLLTSQNGLVFGATFTDVSVRMFVFLVSAAAAVIAAVSALYWSWKSKIMPLAWAVAIYLLVGFLGPVVPSFVQKLVVAPNELVKETPYIQHNIAATRRAYALDKIEEREISGDKPITASDIAANNLTVKNVRLWDRDPLLSTFSQIQEIRTYYEFSQVDNDRYVINGEIRQIMLSPRELSSSSLPNRNWINERLTFTHGYGVAAGPVNQVTPEGLPVLFVKDIPPKSDVKELELARPEIYYGEMPNDYVVVKTKSLEFNYPKGEENVYAAYEGTGGVRLDSLAKRVFYALKFQSLKLLLSNDITNDSRILYHRIVAERVAKIAPFLVFDKDPYIVIADKRIYWVIDAYTTSDRYPYSQPQVLEGKRVNYARNSVKAVVDAFNGSVVFYQADQDDPILKTYGAIFPGMFKPMAEMPAELASHLRYPEDIFALQTAAYSVYHMDDSQIFYNKEDQWEIAAIATDGKGSSSGSMQPRHIIMKLPGETKEEFVLMLPFTPRAKDNLSAWMVARNDGENYGKLLVYRFPKDKLVFGPKQIIGRINQDPEISQQISLWSQGGSQVIQGPLLVIPIEESLMYVRPLYLKAESGKIPELKRVIVAYDNSIAMAGTLEEALSKIFGSGSSKSSEENGEVKTKPLSASDTKRVQDAIAAYEEAMRAQKNGDWAGYGEAIKRLGDILKQ
ncbi:MAG TPA: UPF0182 family protein [Candidatus Paceibacterota bacterium]|nr:UPF0182 family protein [Candidatus Pacearchaeota archaeon]HRZ51467.1 UPF0182 family protein [Candidatus Paceibacterota bacterium]HSA37191.1 UPF0182 family protein [Candidatus Paceibacterota bacterium]